MLVFTSERGVCSTYSESLKPDTLFLIVTLLLSPIPPVLLTGNVWPGVCIGGFNRRGILGGVRPGHDIHWQSRLIHRHYNQVVVSDILSFALYGNSIDSKNVPWGTPKRRAKSVVLLHILSNDDLYNVASPGVSGIWFFTFSSSARECPPSTGHRTYSAVGLSLCHFLPPLSAQPYIRCRHIHAQSHCSVETGRGAGPRQAKMYIVWRVRKQAYGHSYFVAHVVCAVSIDNTKLARIDSLLIRTVYTTLRNSLPSSLFIYFIYFTIQVTCKTKILTSKNKITCKLKEHHIAGQHYHHLRWSFRVY